MDLAPDAVEGQRVPRTKRAGQRRPESRHRPGVAGSLQAAWLSDSKFTGDS